MPMHDFHLDCGKYIIDKADVLFSKCAAVHQCNPFALNGFAFGYPVSRLRFQNYTDKRFTARGKQCTAR